jgi:hypothetical protein
VRNDWRKISPRGRQEPRLPIAPNPESNRGKARRPNYAASAPSWPIWFQAALEDTGQAVRPMTRQNRTSTSGSTAVQHLPVRPPAAARLGHYPCQRQLPSAHVAGSPHCLSRHCRIACPSVACQRCLSRRCRIACPGVAALPVPALPHCLSRRCRIARPGVAALPVAAFACPGVLLGRSAGRLRREGTNPGLPSRICDPGCGKGRMRASISCRAAPSPRRIGTTA